MVMPPILIRTDQPASFDALSTTYLNLPTSSSYSTSLSSHLTLVFLISIIICLSLPHLHLIVFIFSQACLQHLSHFFSASKTVFLILFIYIIFLLFLILCIPSFHFFFSSFPFHLSSFSSITTPLSLICLLTSSFSSSYLFFIL